MSASLFSGTARIRQITIDLDGILGKEGGEICEGVRREGGRGGREGGVWREGRGRIDEARTVAESMSVSEWKWGMGERRKGGKAERQKDCEHCVGCGCGCWCM